MKRIESSGVLVPHAPDCKCPSCWENRYDSLEKRYEQSQKLFEMACDYLYEVRRDCPVENSLVNDWDDDWDDYCDQNCPYDMSKITLCWQKYFKDKLEEDEK